MMRGAMEHYLELEALVLHGRELATLPESMEDRLLEQMDTLWWAMTAEERAEVERLGEQLAALAAPDALGGDVPVSKGDTALPRAA